MLCLLAVAAASRGEESGPRYVAANASRVPAAALGAPGSDTTVATEDNQLAVAVARFRLGPSTLGLGLDYQYTRFEYERVASRNRDLHRLQLPVWIAVPGDRWQLRAHVAPGIFTSSNVLRDFFDRGGRDDWYVSARVEASGTDGAVPWIVGVAHDRAFGKSTTYPVVGINLAPADGVALRLAWPDPAVRFRPAPGQAITWQLFPAGNQWHVRTDDFDDDWDYRYEAWRTQLTWRIGLLRQAGIDLSLGYEFDREHHFSDDGLARLDVAAADHWFVAIGFRLGSAPLPLTHGYHLNR